MFKITRSLWLALLAISAAAAAAFLTFAGPDALAAVLGLSMQALPGAALANFGAVQFKSRGDDSTSLADLREAMEESFNSIEDFKKKHLAKVEELETAVDQLAIKAGRPNLGGSSGAAPTKAADIFIDTKSGREIKVYAGTDPITDPTEVKSDTPTMGRVLRGLVMGGHAPDHKQLTEERKALGISVDPSGGYTVDSVLSNQWIDNLRAAMVLTRAGMQTMPMDSGSMTFVKLTGDPGVVWHGENKDDLATDEPTFGAVTMIPKTAVCSISMSVELAQDGVNIDKMMERAMMGAMAAAIDAAGLNGVTSNAMSAPMTGAGIFDLPGRNTVTSIGAPTSWDFVVDGMYELMADNIPAESIGALIGHPALWKKMRKLKTGLSGDNTPLLAPEEVARLPKLWTTAAPTNKAVLANWRDYIMGVRRQLTFIPHSTRIGTHLQIGLVAYTRLDFAALQSKSFCTLEGITT